MDGCRLGRRRARADRPIVDGRIKPEQLGQLFEVELSKIEDEHHAPVVVLTKAADAMPGFGIVAAVLVPSDGPTLRTLLGASIVVGAVILVTVRKRPE